MLSAIAGESNCTTMLINKFFHGRQTTELIKKLFIRQNKKAFSKITKEIYSIWQGDRYKHLL